jgi:hypothetical protein
MGPSREDVLIGRITKGLKWGGGFLFLAVNTYLLYHFSTAYEDGQRRGTLLHQEREALRKK